MGGKSEDETSICCRKQKEILENPYRRLSESRKISKLPSKSGSALHRLSYKSDTCSVKDYSGKENYEPRVAEQIKIQNNQNLLPTTALQLYLRNRDSLHSCSLSLLRPHLNKKTTPNLQLNALELKRKAVESSMETEIDHMTPKWLQLPFCGIHELVGQAGTGKTQIGLNLCVQATTVAWSMNNGVRSIYISLKGPSYLSRVANRLSQMSGVESDRCANVNGVTKSTYSNGNSSVLSQILIKSCTNTDDLFDVLQNDMPSILRDNKNSVRILIIDSVADLFRGSIDGNNTTKRASDEAVTRSLMLFNLAGVLKRLSDEFHPLPIVVVNQVTSSGLSSNNLSQLNSNLPSESVVPALGLTWAHSVNTSYMLSRSESGIRSVLLTKSSLYQTGQRSTFTINAAGCFSEYQLNEMKSMTNE